MGINFEFATSSQVIFGNNTINRVPDLIRLKGNNILLVTGKDTSRSEKLSEKIRIGDGKVVRFIVDHEPTTNLIDEGVNLARVEGCNVVVGFGGGSAIDAAKAISAMVLNKGSLLDYLEVIGQGKSLSEMPLTCIAIPTTAGTGAEVTKNSVIKSIDHNVKVSLRSNKMYPDFAVVDPTLTLTMPPELTARTGIDALTHLLETYVSNQSNPFIDLLSRNGLVRISSSLVKAYKNGNDLEARENMSLASLFGGMALANVKLGAVHGLAGPMGGMCNAPHGEICASLLPAVMEINIRALKSQNKLSRLKKFDSLAQIFSGNKEATAEDGIMVIKEIVHELNIPRLGSFGLTPDDFPTLVSKAKNSSSMKGNPVVLQDSDLSEILEKSI